MSSVDSPTEHISHMIDLILQPYAQSGESFILDTGDFLRKVDNLKINSEDWLFAMDVTSLYTNIPHDEGIKVVSEQLSDRVDMPSKQSILKLLKLVLKCNCFRFNDKFYLQVNGTAMGTRVAPTYAIMFMNWFEKKYVYPYRKPPRIWWRFIDDVWGIFRGSEEELLAFTKYLNAVHPTIKFTVEYSKDRVNFLDVTTIAHNGRIVSDLHVKETDNHGYLDYSSSHPSHNKLSIPYSQFLRIKRIYSTWSGFAINSLKLCHYLSLRGYPYSLVKEALIKVIKLDRTNALKTFEQTPENTRKLFCIVDFNPFAPNMQNIILKYWPILERSASHPHIVR